MTSASGAAINSYLVPSGNSSLFKTKSAAVTVSGSISSPELTTGLYLSLSNSVGSSNTITSAYTSVNVPSG